MADKERRNAAASLALGTATAALCLLDLVAIRSWLRGGASTIDVLILHFSAVGLLCGMPLVLMRGRSGRLWRWGIVASLSGPFGGIALCLLDLGALIMRPIKPPPVRRPEAVRQVRASDALAARIREGRRHALAPCAPASFEAIFAASDLSAQQRAIASISRNYRPEMREGLQTALASDVPAVRVQAAAVHARLRGSFEAQAKTLLALDNPPDMETAQKADEVARSGFVAPEVAEALEMLAARAPGPVVAPGGAAAAPLRALSRRRDRRFLPPGQRQSCGGRA